MLPFKRYCRPYTLTDIETHVSFILGKSDKWEPVQPRLETVKKNWYMMGLSLCDIRPIEYQNMTEKGIHECSAWGLYRGQQPRDCFQSCRAAEETECVVQRSWRCCQVGGQGELAFLAAQVWRCLLLWIGMILLCWHHGFPDSSNLWALVLDLFLSSIACDVHYDREVEKQALFPLIHFTWWRDWT